MQKMINRCIAKVKEESEINERGGYDVQAPENPSIIVNYNLDNKMAHFYPCRSGASVRVRQEHYRR